MAALPGGTVTFLFTDIEGSTRLSTGSHDFGGPKRRTAMPQTGRTSRRIPRQRRTAQKSYYDQTRSNDAARSTNTMNPL
jgi:hypothetical protein